MMEGTCKTCRWWGTKEILAGYHLCENDNLYVKYEDAGEDSDDYVAPANGLNGSCQEYGVTTGPDFGCVHHELEPTP